METVFLNLLVPFQAVSVAFLCFSIGYGFFLNVKSPCVPQIRWMAAYVMAVFVVTLSVFPVITSRVQTVSKDNAAWGRPP